MEKVKIMIVDDEEIVLRGYAKEFKDSGYDVITIMSGQDAVDVAGQYTVDVIFVDLIMPGMSGVEMCRIIKKISPLTDIILMSGYIDEMQKSWVDFIKAGGRDFFLRKPLSNNELVDTLKTILIERGQGDDNEA